MTEEKRFDMILGKQRARARLREFIKKHIPSRKDAVVVCLPGEHGREIEHVYRKLGFRDENIIGIEVSADALRGIRTHYPRIQVKHGSTDAVLRAYAADPTTPPITVLSLDYCGNYSDDKFDMLHCLAAAGKFADRVIVATNIFSGRESRSTQDALRDRVSGLWQAMHRGHNNHKIALTDAFNVSDDIALSAARDVAACETVIEQIEMKGRALRLAEHGVSADDVTIAATLKDQDCAEATITAVLTAVAQEPALRTELAERIAAYRLATTLKHVLAPVTMLPPEKLRHLVDEVGRGAVRMCVDLLVDTNAAAAVESYSYVNDAGHRMLSDFLLFQRNTDYLRRTPKAVRIEEGAFVLSPGLSEFDTSAAYVQHLSAVFDAYSDAPYFYLLERRPRVDLGGGALPMDTEKTKARVVAMLKKGRTDEEILSKFPVTVGTLRALRANITRGRL